MPKRPRGSVLSRRDGRKPRPAPPVNESRAEQIAREAGVLFRTKGFNGTSLADIAEAAGMTHSALYWHFSSKEEILYQYLLAYGGQGYEAVQVAAQSGPPEQRLWRFVRAFAQYHIDLPDFELGWGILARHGRLGEHLPDDQRQEFVESDQRLIAYVEEILVEGMKAGVFRKLDVRLTTNVILNMCHSPLGAWFLLSGPADPAIVPATYADLALHMVAAEPGIVGRSRDGHSEAVAE